MVVNWKKESQKLFGNQLIKIGRQFIDENGGDPRGAATKAAPEEELDRRKTQLPSDRKITETKPIRSSNVNLY
jgi:hypothetical protein